MHTVYIVYIRSIWGERMTILINNRSGEPIYQQIYAQLRQQILNVLESQDIIIIKSLAILGKRVFQRLRIKGNVILVGTGINDGDDRPPV